VKLFGSLENADGAIRETGGDLEAVGAPCQTENPKIGTVPLFRVNKHIFDHKLVQ